MLLINCKDVLKETQGKEKFECVHCYVMLKLIQILV